MESRSASGRKGGEGILAREKNHSRNVEVGELIADLGNDGNLVSLKQKLAHQGLAGGLEQFYLRIRAMMTHTFKQI